MWAILEIPPTTDIKMIKRAYAVKLKQTHPQDDPVAFQALRQAYEWALQEAKFVNTEMVELDLKVVDLNQIPPSSSQNNAEAFPEPPITASSLLNKPVSIYEIKIEKIEQPFKSKTEYETPLTEPHPKLESLQQPAAPNLFQETKLHAHNLLKLLEETDVPSLKNTLTAYFEQDWFIHIDARAMLEDRLLREIHSRQITPSYNVFAVLMDYFDWCNETLIRNHDDETVIATIRWQFRLEREIYTVKSAQEKSWKKARFLLLLKNSPNQIAFRWYSFNPLILEEAQRKLKLWDEEFPDVYNYLNSESVAWWRDKLAGNASPLFNFNSRSILYFFGASFLASLIILGFSTVTGIIEPNSSTYQSLTWILTLAIFLWLSLHRNKLPEKSAKELSLQKRLIIYAKQFVNTEYGRLMGLGFVAINSLLLLVTFDEVVWFFALINLYFTLSLWLGFRVFMWAFLSSITMFMLTEYIPFDLNNKRSTLHLLGMVVGGIGILKINKMNESLQWGKAKSEFIFCLWLLLMLVLPILMYAQMPWLINTLSQIWNFITMEDCQPACLISLKTRREDYIGSHCHLRSPEQFKKVNGGLERLIFS